MSAPSRVELGCPWYDPGCWGKDIKKAAEQTVRSAEDVGEAAVAIVQGKKCDACKDAVKSGLEHLEDFTCDEVGTPATTTICFGNEICETNMEVLWKTACSEGDTRIGDQVDHITGTICKC